MIAAPDRIVGGEAPAWEHLPSGRVSLLDMINFSLHGFIWALRALNQEISVAFIRAKEVGGVRPEGKEKERLLGNLKFVADACSNLLLTRADDRLGRVLTAVQRGESWAQIAQELKVLAEAIDDDIKYEYFYHYPRNKGLLLARVPGDWAAALTAFPSAQKDIEAGVDCYALGHNTACVFHMMRAAEAGLRAIARERGVRTVRRRTPLEWGTWGDVFTAIETALEGIKQATAGPKKDGALAFYNSALSDLRALQDLYRDRTVHLRAEGYDDGQAQSAMTRVRHLLGTLAMRLTEDKPKRIRWGI